MKNKLFYLVIFLIIISIILNIININYFKFFLSIIWYIVSVILIYSGIKYSIKYKFIGLNIKKIIKGIFSKSKNDISPLSSLSLSLAAKIGVGSLSGVALAIYYGGIGTIFWIWIISLIVAINTYLEVKLGVIYHGGPSKYIKMCLYNDKLSKLYSILIIISYSILFLSIQSNTIIKTVTYFNINKELILIILSLFTFLSISKGIKKISKINSILVPIMLIFYFVLGIYVIINNIGSIGYLFKNIIINAFNYKSIISVFLIGMQRAIFITESGIGTSAISASITDSTSDNQAMLEVMGIYIVSFLVCSVTFLIISLSDYNNNIFLDINGIEIVLYAFKYHFGNIGSILLSIITILFAFSTITSSYFFGITNLKNNKYFKYIVIIIIILSAYIKPNMLWNYTDLFIAMLTLINIYAILKINK